MHGFETGDTVTFKEVRGMTELNGQQCQIQGQCQNILNNNKKLNITLLHKSFKDKYVIHRKVVYLFTYTCTMVFRYVIMTLITVC